MSADKLASAVADVVMEGPNLLYDGYRPVEGWRVTLPAAGARGVVRQQREVLRSGPCIGVIAFDPERDELVFIRQFRAAAHVATGFGDLVEIVAGRVEPGEDLEFAARRELMEEAGVEATRIVQLFQYLATPGIVDELATIFLARVDARGVPEHAGAPDENEVTRPFVATVDEAIASIGDARPKNGYLLVALQWLALNRSRLKELLA